MKTLTDEEVAENLCTVVDELGEGYVYPYANSEGTYLCFYRDETGVHNVLDLLWGEGELSLTAKATGGAGRGAD